VSHFIIILHFFVAAELFDTLPNFNRSCNCTPVLMEQFVIVFTNDDIGQSKPPTMIQRYNTKNNDTKNDDTKNNVKVALYICMQL